MRVLVVPVVISSHFRESHGPWPTHGGTARDRTVVRAWSLLTDDRQKLTMRSLAHKEEKAICMYLMLTERLF
jgi:hypothetical protein